VKRSHVLKGDPAELPKTRGGPVFSRGEKKSGLIQEGARKVRQRVGGRRAKLTGHPTS